MHIRIYWMVQTLIKILSYENEFPEKKTFL